VKDEAGQGFGGRLLSLVMLNVLDEKWKDHLYDLDQLRAAIHYRSWGQKDPLIEYKQEAYTMFVDLMNDIHTTFTERFLRAQLVFGPPGGDGGMAGPGGAAGSTGPTSPPTPSAPRRRYNALGILEDILEEEPATANGSDGDGHREVMDVAPDEPPKQTMAARQDPLVVGAGKTRSMSEMAGARRGVPGAVQGEIDWSSVGRNDPCPCGSGKKFKKCHGANA